MRHSRHEQLQVIIDFRHRSDGRARAFDRVRLLDRDGRWNSTNFVNLGLVHAIEKLPRVGAESLDVAALALRVNCVEGEARFTAPARSGDNR
jgi:hypothetical protein